VTPDGAAMVATVDDDDHARVARYRWRAYRTAGGNATHYAAARIAPSVTMSLHHFVLDVPDGTVVDHLDGNGLNNVRGNLRVCTLAENSHNKPRRGAFLSIYKGVTLTNGRWVAGITVAGKRKYLGAFDDEEVAARAYDAEARLVFGPAAVVNFPSDPAEHSAPPSTRRAPGSRKAGDHGRPPRPDQVVVQVRASAQALAAFDDACETIYRACRADVLRWWIEAVAADRVPLEVADPVLEDEVRLTLRLPAPLAAQLARAAAGRAVDASAIIRAGLEAVPRGGFVPDHLRQLLA